MILIDLDGTLVDSVPDLASSVHYTMTQLARPPWDEAHVRNWVGNGVERLVRRALTGTLDEEPEEALFQQAYPIFLAHYEKHTCVHSKLYPGVRAGLDQLKSAGYPLGCVTNKATIFTETLLKTLALRNDFSLLLCGDTLAKKKPDPLPLLHAADFFGVKPEQALMVGDSISDVKAARAAKFQVACMTYGYNHGLDIRTAKPDAILDSLVELPALLDLVT